jgi:putative SOS response-associated peptidase YedK
VKAVAACRIGAIWLISIGAQPVSLPPQLGCCSATPRLPNATVKPVHAKAMPVILTAPDDMDRWLTAPAVEALELQRPLPDNALHIVMRGEKEDAVAA